MSGIPFFGKKKASPGEEERVILPAEKLFDQAVYGGISYAAQAATGIMISHWLRHGGGKKYFDKVAAWAGPKLFSGRPAEEAIKAVSNPIIVTTMIMVGNTFLFPVKWLEDHKPAIVRSIYDFQTGRRKAKGQIISPEEKARDEESLVQLEQEPKQTWASLLGGRAFGLGVVYSALFGMGKTNDRIENFAIKNIAKGLNGAGLKSLAKSRLLDEYLHIGFLDVFYSAVSTAGLYVYSHFLNPPKDEKEENIAKVSDETVIASPLTPLLVEAEVEAEKKTAPKKSFASSVKPLQDKAKTQILDQQSPVKIPLEKFTESVPERKTRETYEASEIPLGMGA